MLLLLQTGFACFRFAAQVCCAMLPRATTHADWGNWGVFVRRHVFASFLGRSNEMGEFCELRVVGFAALWVAPFVREMYSA